MVSTLAGCKVKWSLLPVLANDTAEGTGLGVNRTGYEDALMIAHFGNSGDTLSGTTYWTLTFQECATNTAGNYTLIGAGDLDGGTGTFVCNEPTEDSQTVTRLYKGSLPWVRILFTQTGTHTNGTPLSGMVILGRPHHFPVTQTTEVQA